MLIDSHIRRVRWQAQEQAAAALTMQAQMMGGKRTQAQDTPQQAPKRKQPALLSMEQFVAAQGSK